MSVPNQKIIKIIKPISKDFLQVQNEDWLQAYRELKPSAFALYLYFASNQNGYELELSQVDVENKLGIKKTAYHDAYKQLVDFGYLVPTNRKNCIEFYTAKSANAEK